MSVDNKVVTWVDKTVAKAETDRTLNDTWSIADFGWLHLPCEVVTTETLEIIGSKSKVRLFCSKHKVSSKVEEIQAQ